MEREAEERELIQLVLSGQKELYGALYENTVEDVYRTVHFLLDEKADVDDIVQEVYVQAYQALHTFDQSRPLRPWLTGIAIKQVQAYRRKRWVRFRIMKKAEIETTEAAMDVADTVACRIGSDALVSLIEKLPYKLKQVIILRYLNEYSQDEIAAILHIPAGTVKSRIHAGLKKLRRTGDINRIFFEKVGDVQ